MVNPTVVLFDIDGTLLSCGGAGREAMRLAFEERTGQPEACDFPFAGCTDASIARRGLENAGAPTTDAHIELLIESYLNHLSPALEASTEFRVFGGVVELLARLEAQPAVALGLGTGNVERGARAKLRRGDLDHWFAFGGFGCDDEVRSRLIEAGALRGVAALGLPREACRVVVIGDTERDVSAAKSIGAECIAVETGSIPRSRLVEAGPELCVADLTESDVVRFLLG